MYTIKSGRASLLDLRYEEYYVENPIVRIEANTVGSATFTIYDTHPHYDIVKSLKSVIEIADDVGAIFRGRVNSDTVDFYGGKSVELEGLMACFNDSIVRPFSFPEDFLEDEGYLAAAESGNVVAFFLGWLINNHNAQTEDFQHFQLGEVTVSDPNNYITRADSGYANTWEILKTKLFDSALGGYLCIRYEADGNYIDYLSDFTLTNTQQILFGENLLDMSTETDAGGVFSAVLPIGAEITSTDEEGNTTKKLVTLESLEDGDVTEDIVKSGDTLYSRKAVEELGWIYAPVSDTTWGDVTLASNLLTKATERLVNEGAAYAITKEFTAADLHLTGEDVQGFRIYRKVRVKIRKDDYLETFNLLKLEIPLLQPQNTKITVGGTKTTLTDLDGRQESQAIARLESVQVEVAESKSEISEIKTQMIEDTTQLLTTCEEIVIAALHSYLETSSYEEYKETVAAQFQLLAERIEMTFSESLEQIANVDGDLQAKYNTITKYFTFDVDGLTIGQSDNPNKVVIDNDEISILVNGLVVQRFDAEGRALIPELTVTQNFDLFGYQINQDSDGRVNCDFVGGDA